MHKIIKAGLISLVIFVVGCSTTSQHETQQPETTTIEEGALSIEALLQAANTSTDPLIKTQYQLRAADIYRQNLEFESAQSILELINYPALPLHLQEQYMLIALSIAVEEEDIEQTTQLLSNIPAHFFQQVPPEIQRHAGEGGAVMFTTHQSLSFAALPVQTILLSDND